MHDEGRAAGCGDRLDEAQEKGPVLAIIDADALLHRHWQTRRALHGGDGSRDGRRLLHQTGAEAAFLHAVGGAATVEIDLVVTPLLGECGAVRERRGIAAAELQGERKLLRIEGEMPRDVTMQQCAGGDHLGVHPRMAREPSPEEPAMPVRPVHAGGCREAPGRVGCGQDIMSGGAAARLSPK